MAQEGGKGIVLVVEDDGHLQETLDDVLTAEGYGVARAGDGQQALALLRAGLRPEVIVLDLMMPGMDGWQMMDELQADPALSAIPVIVTTAVPARAPTGAQRYLAKPLQLDEFLRTVEQHGARAGIGEPMS